MVKRSDVAKLAGVSEATVSRAFNNVGPLKQETKEKVFKAAKALNYHPNALAQHFAKGKSGNIGVIVPYLPRVNLLSTHYFSEILGGIGVKLGEHQYNLLLMFQSPDQPKNYVQYFQSQKIDGCIILGAQNRPGEKEEIAQLHQSGYPYCLVNQKFEGENFNIIGANHYEGSFNAVSYLLRKGFKRVAFLSGPEEYSDSIERLKGYEDALVAFGVELNEDWIYDGNYSRTSGEKIAIELGQRMSEFDAVFSSNDRMAVGLMQGLSAQGFHVGHDYVLIGYDDSDIAKMVHPPLSTVSVPLFQMGKIAAENIVDALHKGEFKAVATELPVEFIERASTQKIKRG